MPTIQHEVVPGTPFVHPRPAFVMLGKYGDLINILPVVRDVGQQLRTRPAFFVSREFADLFEGIGYVDAVPVNYGVSDLSPAVDKAHTRFADVRVVQVSSDMGDLVQESSFNQDAWRLAGYLDRFADRSLKPFFDRRNYTRERKLLRANWVCGDHPVVLVNLAGSSSSFRDAVKFAEWLDRQWGDRVDFIDLSQIQAERIFDLLGFMEMADALITVDTATLHLAAATDCPVIALLSDRGRWRQSAPRCEVLLSFVCSDWEKNQTGIDREMESIVSTSRRIVHCHALWDDPGNQRCGRARASWRELPWIQAPFGPVYPRDARQIGDFRDLPYLRDVLECGLRAASDSDIVVLTNADTYLLPAIDRLVRDQLRCQVMTCGIRRDVAPDSLIPGVQADRRFQVLPRHAGRDLVAFRAGWLRHNFDRVPDFLLGSGEWDSWAANLAKILAAATPIDWQFDPKVEIGEAILHESHEVMWNCDDSPSLQWNRRLNAAFRIENAHYLGSP